MTIEKLKLILFKSEADYIRALYNLAVDCKKEMGIDPETLQEFTGKGLCQIATASISSWLTNQHIDIRFIDFLINVDRREEKAFLHNILISEADSLGERLVLDGSAKQWGYSNMIYFGKYSEYRELIPHDNWYELENNPSSENLIYEAFEGFEDVEVGINKELFLQIPRVFEEASADID